ncbi:unnamed protein product [Thelazia callipaeda]|uniref:Nuclear transcription factor Y subunit beta n=1 Tax=Thelazia callipaeda TaxID=103827 RepID=A0A0N5CK14_THECL|nr:unnamed protein product [Thelazia callipaeda]
MSGEKNPENFLSERQREDSACQTDGTLEEINGSGQGGNDHSEDNMSPKPILEQDRFLPIANISRLMKNVIPRSGKVAKDAKECVQECVSEFISFITSEACDRCINEKRKTITGEDIILAFSTLGFDNYVEPMSVYVKKFREAFRADRSNETITESSSSQASFLEKVNVNQVVSHSDVYTIQDGNEPVPSTSDCTSQVVFAEPRLNFCGCAFDLHFVYIITQEDADGVIRVLDAGNVQQLQFLMDPTTGQHYINVQNPNGTQQLLPIQVNCLIFASSRGIHFFPCFLDFLLFSSINVATVSDTNPSLPSGILETDNRIGDKVMNEEMPSFVTEADFRPSLAESNNVTLMEAQMVAHGSEPPINNHVYEIAPEHDITGCSMANAHHKEHIPYVATMGQYGHHQMNRTTGEHSRKRSHDGIEYISFE